MLKLGNLFGKRETSKPAQPDPKRATATQEIVKPILPEVQQHDRSSERLLRGLK